MLEPSALAGVRDFVEGLGANVKLKAAIVGAGLMGRWHATYAERAGAAVTAIVDSDVGRAQLLAARFRAARAASAEHFDAICGGVDVVHICTPAGSHEQLTRRALAAGAHVLVEKPLAGSSRVTGELFAYAKEQGRLLAPVHQFPFQRGMRALQAELAELGALRQIDYTTYSAGADGKAAWQRREVLLEILPHPISLLRALGARVATRDWKLARFDDEALELTTRLRGASVRVCIDLAARPTCNELHVVGEHASAVADLFHGFHAIDRARTTRLSKALRPFRQNGRGLWAATSNLCERTLRREPAYPGLPQLISDFYSASNAGRRAPIDPEESMDVAELREHIESMQGALRVSSVSTLRLD